jgi:hypothetical protein
VRTRCHEVSQRPLPEARPAPALPRPPRAREDWTRLADDALGAIQQGAGRHRDHEWAVVPRFLEPGGPTHGHSSRSAVRLTATSSQQYSRSGRASRDSQRAAECNRTTR